MSINYRNIEKLLVLPSLSDLLEQDRHLMDNNLKEENINHRFAVHLETNLHKLNTRIKYHVDVEYDKKIDAKKTMTVDNIDFIVRPDVLIHKRGQNQYNLLAVEAKKKSISLRDEQKMRGFLSYDYNYQFGLLLTYGIPKSNYIRYVILYKPKHPHPPIHRKIVLFYKRGNFTIKQDWDEFIPRNDQPCV
jgi:hypothetical protein